MKGEVCNTFLAFCELSRACIRAKFPQSHQECRLIFSRWPIQDLRPHILAVTCSLLLTALFYPLLCSASFGFAWDLAFSRPLKVSWEISHASPLCGFRAKTDWHLPIPTQQMPTSCHTNNNNNNESDNYTNFNWYSWYSPQRIGTRSGGAWK